MDSENNGTVNILFMSDLHYGLSKIKDSEIDYDRYRDSRKKVLESLIQHLTNNYQSRYNKRIEKTRQKIDLLAFSGDIGWTGSKKDYEEFFNDFLDRLLKLELIEPGRLVVCMGNHDIDRNRADRDAKKTKNQAVSRFPLPETGSMNGILDNLNPSDKKIMNIRFKHFEAASMAFAECGAIPLENSFTVHSVEGVKSELATYTYGYCQPIPGIHFLVLNSAWDHRSAEKDPNHSGKKIPMMGRLRTGTDTCMDATKFLKSARLCGVSDRYRNCPDRMRISCDLCPKRLRPVDEKSIVAPSGVTITMFHHPFYSIQGKDYRWLHECEISEDIWDPQKNTLGKILAEETDLIFNGHTHVTDMTEPFAEPLKKGDKKLPAFMSGALYSNDTYDFGCWILSFHYTQEDNIRAYHGYTAKRLHYEKGTWTSDEYFEDNREHFLMKTMRESLVSVLQALGKYEGVEQRRTLPSDIVALISALIKAVLELIKHSHVEKVSSGINEGKHEDEYSELMIERAKVMNPIRPQKRE